MSRKPRIWYPGATYHIYARGNRRATIFHDSDDYQQYLSNILEVREQYPFVLHSYCLMTNHLHLQLQTSTHHIQAIMKELHFRYAIYFNKRYDLIGHVFQGRYGASLTQSAGTFLQNSRYIHRNPIEAGMVQAPETYPWSSYAAYLSTEEDPYVDKTMTLAYFPPPANEHYQSFVEKETEEEAVCLQK